MNLQDIQDIVLFHFFMLLVQVFSYHLCPEDGGIVMLKQREKPRHDSSLSWY